MYDFTNGLAALAERRDALVAAARRGKQSADDALCDVVTEALCFAIYAVKTPVKRQEEHYSALIENRPINGTSRQRDAERNARAWIARMDRETFYALFDDKTGHAFAEKATLCHGLGCAKATYAAACLGFTDCPCFDRHTQRLCGVPERSIYRWSQYWAQCDAASVPMRTTLDQWSAFPAPDYDGHSIYFNRQLAGVTEHRISAAEQARGVL
jgi:hypothetical protein